MGLHPDTVEQPPVPQQVDDRQVLSAGRRIVLGSVLIDQQQRVGEVLAGELERGDYPIPTSGTVAAQGGFPWQWCLDRFVDHVDGPSVRITCRIGLHPLFDLGALLSWR